MGKVPRWKHSLFAALLLLFPLLSSLHGAESRPAWQVEWEKTVEAAKREAQLVAYGGEEITHIEILRAFNKEYPDIKVVTASGHGSELGARIIAERRAGKYLVDVYAGGPSTPYRVLYLGKALEPIGPALILPEVTDTSRWYGGKYHYADPENRYLLMYEGSVSSGGTIYYNTNLVDPKELKSYWDLFNPKWMGKILFMDPRSSSLGLNTSLSLYNHPQLGAEYIKRLFREMKVAISGNRRQGTDWLSTGKFALCFACRDIKRAMKQGLPINEIEADNLKEGGSEIGGGGSSVIVLLNKAPNPNAAKLFLNWYLSRQGQMVWQRVMNTTVIETSDSMRVDIPKDDVIPDGRRVEGRTYRIVGFRDPKPVLKLLDEVLR